MGWEFGAPRPWRKITKLRIPALLQFSEGQKVQKSICGQGNADNLLGCSRSPAHWFPRKRNRSQSRKIYYNFEGLMKMVAAYLTLQWLHIASSLQCQTTHAIDTFNFDVIIHPQYSLDLAPWNFYLFLLLKRHLKSQQFSSCAAVKRPVISWIRSRYANMGRTLGAMREVRRGLCRKINTCFERRRINLYFHF